MGEDVNLATKKIGCKFSLDDFGTGLASFEYLKKLPVDELKIDGIFVSAMKESHVDRVIVESINSVAHSMGLVTVAEFVTDSVTMLQLKELGVDYGQGFIVGKPKPIDDIK